ncbi:MAG TPA: alpha-galactosidase [Candidatus Hydrogenedentes bacterium]|nr:alpha-galactosidase [Candidatus Hydrogenedentota bacterium]HRT21691.1 alpha-galactosidase [Candidatus Hydrogenedentota bacterium]HRT66532.1 alpha-galactosidase [Candidatus Hydrogenedentota bacterium]
MIRGLFVSIGLSVLVLVPDTALAQREPRAFRTINTDQYEVAVHKNGLIDIRVNRIETIATGLYPMIWIEGEAAPKPFPVDARYSNRAPVNNRLGEGQGMWFKKGTLDWIVETYPTKPFMTIQVAFENTTKKPVTIKALIPWALGGEKKGSLNLGLGSGGSVILENGRHLGLTDEVPQVVAGKTQCLSNCTAFNPTSGLSLTAGFLTMRHAYGRIMLELDDDPTRAVMRADCIFDPPIEVPPGKRLESEIFYVALTERNPFDGLEHFGQAVGAFNDAGPQGFRLPHGWDSWNTALKSDINESNILAALDVFDRDLKRYGWTHFAIGGGWQQATGTWEPDSAKFPHGMKWLADQIHSRKMTAGLWLDPFTAHVNSAVAREHPDWLRQPAEAYRSMLDPDDRIIDVTIPEAYAWVRDLAARVGNDWGFDTLQQGDFACRLLYADRYAAVGVTRVDVFRMGVQALREGLGGESLITSFSPAQVTAPVWRRETGRKPWGCVEAMTNAARRYYFAPHCWIADTDCSYFGIDSTRERWSVGHRPPLSAEQAQAWLTAAALTGGVIKMGDWPPDLDAGQRALLTRLLPTIGRSARPVDLFEGKTPAIWSLPIQCAVGSWHVVAVFNWNDAAPAKIPLDFTNLGLNFNRYYTVYDFWRDKFYGLAKGRLMLDMPPGSVRLLGLRAYEGRPMFLATDRHFTQGATDFTRLEWNAQTRLLSGTFTGIAETDYNLRIFVPDEYAVKSSYCSAEAPKTEQDGKVYKLGFRCIESAPVNWNVQF